MPKSEFKVVLAEKLFPNLEIEEEIFKGMSVSLYAEKLESEQDLVEAAQDADGLMSIYFPITRNAIQRMEKMKVMSVWGVGTNHIDVQAASEKGVIISNVPDYCTDEVSSHAVALILGCARQISQYDRLFHKGVWAYGQIPLNRFAGKTVGIVGLGAIGRAVAEKLAGFNVNLIGFDAYVSKEIMEAINVRPVDLQELLTSSDFITVHTPLTDETRNMFSEKQFKAMKESAFIINTSRGEVIDEKALKEALDAGRIAGAALDVIANESHSKDHPLIGHEKVTITPHVGWFSLEAKVECRVKAAQAIKAVLCGNKPESIVNSHLL
jgi:D-3-phosphoglycerate dehydrogenase